MVGLAVARALSLRGREVVVLEAEAGLGQHASSRNSEVLHAGFYYEPGTLKAQLCVQGRRMLLAYAAEKGIACALPGKLVVAATAAGLERLDAYRSRGLANGVEGLARIGAAEVSRMEPALRCAGGLLEPRDRHHRRARAFAGAARRRRGGGRHDRPAVARALGRREGRWNRAAGGGAAPFTLQCAAVVNAAGLGAPALARSIEGMPAELIPESRYARGHYFVLAGKIRFAT